MSKININKDTLIASLETDFPEVLTILTEYGLHCVGCPLSQVETIEQGGHAHGMSDVEIAEMINEINARLADKES